MKITMIGLHCLLMLHTKFCKDWPCSFWETVTDDKHARRMTDKDGNKCFEVPTENICLARPGKFHEEFRDQIVWAVYWRKNSFLSAISGYCPFMVSFYVLGTYLKLQEKLWLLGRFERIFGFVIINLVQNISQGESCICAKNTPHCQLLGWEQKCESKEDVYERIRELEMEFES